MVAISNHLFGNEFANKLLTSFVRTLSTNLTCCNAIAKKVWYMYNITIC